MIIKPIPGWSGYFATDTGCIVSTKQKKARILRLLFILDNRATVMLSIHSKQTRRYVHRLVLFAFKGPCPEGMECAHLDGNPMNNHLSNLVWVTHTENESHKSSHGTRINGEQVWNSRLVNADVLEIRHKLSQGALCKALALEYGVCRSAIALIKSGRRWAHLLNLEN